MDRIIEVMLAVFLFCGTLAMLAFVAFMGVVIVSGDLDGGRQVHVQVEREAPHAPRPDYEGRE